MLIIKTKKSLRTIDSNAWGYKEATFKSIGFTTRDRVRARFLSL